MQVTNIYVRIYYIYINMYITETDYEPPGSLPITPPITPSPQNYVRTPRNINRGYVTFDPSLGLNSTYLELFLNDDDVVESTEYFVLTFTIDSYLQSLGILPGPHDETIVAIEDNNSKCTRVMYTERRTICMHFLNVCLHMYYNVIIMWLDI